MDAELSDTLKRADMKFDAAFLPPDSQTASLLKFHQTALRFYMRGDADAEAVLMQFEETDAVVVTMDGSGLAEECGIPVPGSRRQLYIDAKDAARTEAHSLLLQERRAAFQAAFMETQPTNGSPTTWSHVKKSVAGLRTFATKYAGNVAVQPLVRGAIALLLEQQKASCVVSWIIDSAVFTETGVDLRDVINFFQNLPLIRVDLAPDSVTLELYDDWSDANLHRLINSARRFVVDDLSDVSPTGRFVHTDRSRRNVDGDIDDPPLCFDASCLDLTFFFNF